MNGLLRRALVAAALLAAAHAHADPVQEVRQAEIAFAKAFADRDAEKFFGFVLDDATFFGARTLRGRAAVRERWGALLAQPEAPFSWEPERVAVNAAGTIGMTTGPVYGRDGKRSGSFTSTWVRQTDGTWKILFDGQGPSPACMADAAANVDEGFVTTDDGVRLHYTKIGRGPATVIVPLEYAMYDDWRQLADIATVIAYDPRNRGRSDRVTDLNNVSFARDVDDLEAVRKALNVDRFVPIGFSYLGKMVVHYAAKYPDRVLGVVQLGPVPMDPSRPYERLSREGAGIPEEDWNKVQRLRKSAGGGRELCEAELAVNRYMLVGDPSKVFRVSSWCALPNEWSSNLGPHFERLIPTEQAMRLSKDDLARITVPVLTIHGTKDRLAPFGGGRDWAASLPNAALVTIPNGGHAMWLDEPAAVFAAVRAFLRGAGTPSFEWPLGAERVAP